MASRSLTLIIGDKNLSSWSLRPWLAMKAAKLEFKEFMIRLDRADTKVRIAKQAPSGTVPALTVPILRDGKITIWDSLAICEYLAELAPDRLLWPESASARAEARSYVAEMHSGFAALRNQLSMDIQCRIRIKHLTPQTIADIERVLELWERALKKSKGPFLFGTFGIVDAYYAPVVFRFRSYGIEIKSPAIRKYMARFLAHPAVKEWERAALLEKPSYESF